MIWFSHQRVSLNFTSDAFQEAEQHHADELQAVEKVKAELQEKIDEMLKQEDMLTAKVKWYY